MAGSVGSLGYCARCRIGTLDAEGLCVLCGASAAPLTLRRRLAEWSGAFLSFVIGPVGAAVLFLAVASLVLTSVAQQRARLPAPLLRPLVPSAPGFESLARGDAAGAIVGLLLPALMQGLIFFLLLVLLFALFRRRRRPAKT